MPNKKPNKRRRRTNRTGNRYDSRLWRIPLNPPETTQAEFPVTLNASLKAFGATKAGKFVVTYPAVVAELGKQFNLPDIKYVSIRITSYAVYGLTSVLPTQSLTSVQKSISIEDAYTGREVRGYSTPVVRARAGIIQNPLRQMRWYNAGNDDENQEKHLFYLRIGDEGICPDEDNMIAYNCIVAGYVRISKFIGACS